VTATISDGTLSNLLIQSVWRPRRDHTKGRRLQTSGESVPACNDVRASRSLGTHWT
jgi:hypothetical protein